jgi:hypothetical protein
MTTYAITISAEAAEQHRVISGAIDALDAHFAGCPHYDTVPALAKLAYIAGEITFEEFLDARDVPVEDLVWSKE